MLAGDKVAAAICYLQSSGERRDKMFNKRKLWSTSPIFWVLSVSLLVITAVTFFLNRTVFIVEAIGVSVVLLILFIRIGILKHDLNRYVIRVTKFLDQTNVESLSKFPLPVMSVTFTGEVVWYNQLFRNEVLNQKDVMTWSLEKVFDGVRMDTVKSGNPLNLTYNQKMYSVYISVVKDQRDALPLYLLYFVEDTVYKQTLQEYTQSRPVVLSIYIDNLDELTQSDRESQRASLSGQVEKLLEDWVNTTNGILRKYSSDRYLVVVENRDLQNMIESKFDILDTVRAIPAGERMYPTLSIGVGQGESIRVSESMAKQALEMALGRGGDQVAVKTNNGYDFYGGLSKGVEKRTKVRTRIMASALTELIQNSEIILIMGHRYADLDCVGAAVGLVTVCRNLNKSAFVVIERKTCLTKELLNRYDEVGKSDLFIEPSEAMSMVDKHTLLIITDTHNPCLVQSQELLNTVESVAVIDHHRKMVEYIQDSLLFFHEPYASSTSEMVTELIQYMPSNNVSRLEAEALLAGIMLDTRNFILRAGVRTFEAAAYLRKLGADTVEVKRLFSGSMHMYQTKASIIAGAEIFENTAISCTSGEGAEVRIAASQAADELLSIRDVDASFVLFYQNDCVNISSRSLGNYNVQLIMEALGGGGHMTMAGCMIQNAGLDEAKELLMSVIKEYQEKATKGV